MRWGIVVAIAILAAALLAGCARKQDGDPATDAPPTPESTRMATGVASASPGPDTAGLPDVGSLPESTPPPQVYIVQSGDTLSAIAARFGCTVEALVEANQITNPNALQLGQQLDIPSTQVETGPATHLLPNSEFVNSPAYVDFDVAAFCAEQGGYLNVYQESVNGKVLSGPEIVEYVVHHYSVGPRLLLAILEMKSGWVTDPNPTGEALIYPMGYKGGGWESLHQQLAWAADELNRGYYDWRGRGMRLKTWSDGTALRYAPTLNAATVGLQYFFSLNASKSQWEAAIGKETGSFAAAYRQFFGDPDQYAIVPLIPADTTCPALALPWTEGELWWYTGGPHGGWNEGSAWSAIDVVPDEGYLGCQAAASWATAAASGLVIYSDNGEVLIDLDEDGRVETGWVLFYLHVATQGRVAEGTRVEQGDPIGHPSCEGGFSESTHLHLARRYNGEWIAADGPLPLVLSGWQFHSTGTSYDGGATRGNEQRTACECREAEFNGLVAGR